jgi:hypothetical protein
MRAAFASANFGRSGSPVGALSEANWRKIEKWRAGQDETGNRYVIVFDL